MLSYTQTKIIICKNVFPRCSIDCWLVITAFPIHPLSSVVRLSDEQLLFRLLFKTAVPRNIGRGETSPAVKKHVRGFG